MLGVTGGASSAPALAARIYDVGPGYTRTTLRAVPWQRLKPGTTVRIHGFSGAYHERVWLTESGTHKRPIRIQGILGPNGQRPIIDGDRATAAYPAGLLGSAGQYVEPIVLLGIHGYGHPYGFRPSNLIISGLELRNAHPDHQYAAQGGLRPWDPSASALWIGGADHITVCHMTFSHNGNGIFAKNTTGDRNGETSALLIDRNLFRHNGTVGSDRQHQSYTEASGTIYQGNRFENPAPAQGNNIKDRGAGTVIRYNWIHGGGHLIDLVDTQESVSLELRDPTYRVSLVYGNILLNTRRGANSLVHYGGDTCGSAPEPDVTACSFFANYRQGTLYFYNNTVVQRRDQDSPDGYHTALFDLSTNGEHAVVDSNIIYNAPATQGHRASAFSIAQSNGEIALGTNWISPKTTSFSHYAQPPAAGSLTGSEHTLTNVTNEPGFIDVRGNRFGLRRSAQSIDRSPRRRGGPIVGSPPKQYEPGRSITVRHIVGAAPDLGAWERSRR